MLKDNQSRSSYEHARSIASYQKLNASAIESCKPYPLLANEAVESKSGPKVNVLMKVLNRRDKKGARMSNGGSKSPSLLTGYKFRLNNRQTATPEIRDIPARDRSFNLSNSRNGVLGERAVHQGKKSRFVQYKKRKFCDRNPLKSRLKSRGVHRRNPNQACKGLSKEIRGRGKSPLEKRPFSLIKTLKR